MNPRALLAVVGWTMIWLSAPSAQALINPHYTPVDLVRDSGQVFVVRVESPQKWQITGEITEALVGDMPTDRKLVFDFRDAEELTDYTMTNAFGGQATAVAVMCVQKRTQGGETLGALEIGTTWVGLVQGKTKSHWLMDRDPNDLETVWGGSARQLIPAIRYILSDPRAEFPVASTPTWGSDLLLGKAEGRVHGCLTTAIGTILLSEGGDLVYRTDATGTPTDVTAKLNLASKSKAMAAGDFNADGHLDLASWDGARLQLIPGRADGTFAAPAASVGLDACCCLAAIGRGLVAGTRDGVALLETNGDGTLTSSRLAVDTTSLGPGGVCAVADFNDDGATDIVQVFAHGLVFHAGGRDASEFAAPVVTKLDAGKHPTTVVCGDYDTDGQLDLIVGGVGGTTLLSRSDDGRWRSTIAETGELGAASGIGQGSDVVMAACASDVNGDGRQCAAFFHAASGPGLFFSRGFACFGIAWSLEFSESRLPAAKALGTGQTTGLLADLDGDRVPDLLAVDRQQGIWALFAEAERPPRFQAVLSLADPATGPRTVTAVMNQRRLGIWVVRPGQPATINLPGAGKLQLQWKAPDGTYASRDVIVTRPTPVAL